MVPFAPNNVKRIKIAADESADTDVVNFGVPVICIDVQERLCAAENISLQFYFLGNIGRKLDQRIRLFYNLNF